MVQDFLHQQYYGKFEGAGRWKSAMRMCSSQAATRKVQASKHVVGFRGLGFRVHLGALGPSGT